MTANPMKYSKATMAMLFLCIGIVITMLCFYLQDPYLWYDEAGQFFISKGLNHDSLPCAEPGSLYDVIINNSDYNMDPGGFSLILYFWSLVSNNWLYLRLLPVLFYVLFSIFLFLIAKKETNNVYLALFIATLSYVLPVMANRITELRAYSMELCGTMLGVWFLYWCNEKMSYKRILTASILLSLFSTARYGALISCSMIAFCLFVMILKKSRGVERVKKALLLSIPMMLSVCACALMMFHQNGNAGQMSYADYISNNHYLLLHPLSLLLYYLLVRLAFIVKRGGHISLLQVSTILICSVYFILSIFGYYPWEPHRTISAYALLTFCFLIDVLNFLKLKFESALKIGLPLVLLFSMVSYMALFDRLHPAPLKGVMEEFETFMDSPHESGIIITPQKSPTVRYLYEYGIFKQRAIKDDYPNSFIFLSGKKHSEEHNVR